MKKAYSKIKAMLALMTALVLVLSAVPVMAANVIDDTATGSITVTKYYSETAKDDHTLSDSTGTAADADNVPSDYAVLSGAEFKLYQVMTTEQTMEYFNGSTEEAYTVDDFANGDAVINLDGDAATLIATGTTGADGTYTFSNLAVGMYVLVETTAAEQVTAPLCEDTLISVPMVNTDTSSNNGNTDWFYDVKVYPKNHTSEATVNIKKMGDDNTTPLAGVTYALYKQTGDDATSADSWTAVTSTTAINGTAQPINFTTDANGEVTITNIPAGLEGTNYMLYEVSAPEGYIVNSTPIYFTVSAANEITNISAATSIGLTAVRDDADDNTTTSDEETLNVYMRNEIPNVEKTVKSDGANTYVNAEDYAIGDTVSYKVVIDVPNNITLLGADAEDQNTGTFELLDTYDSSVFATPSNITVTYANGNVAGAAYTVDTATAGTLKVTFHPDQMAAYAGQQITVSYDTTLLKDAAIGGKGNKNTAKLTYDVLIPGGNPNLPEDPDDDDDISDDAVVYTFGLLVTKTLQDASSTDDVTAVEFNLYQGTTQIKVSKYENYDTGWYYVDPNGSATLSPDSSGYIYVNGLEADTYVLKETKTVTGYNLLSDDIEISVGATFTSTWDASKETKAYVLSQFGTGTSAVKHSQAADATDIVSTQAIAEETVINKKGFTLPLTGSFGYILICLAGIVLIGGGAFVFLNGRKRIH